MTPLCPYCRGPAPRGHVLQCGQAPPHLHDPVFIAVRASEKMRPGDLAIDNGDDGTVRPWRRRRRQ